MLTRENIDSGHETSAIFTENVQANYLLMNASPPKKFR